MSVAKNEKIWKDFILTKIIYILLTIIYLVFLILDFFFELDIESSLFIKILALIIILLIIVNLFRLKFSYITPSGIRIGNAHKDTYEFIKLVFQAKFIQWKEIKSITIKGRSIRRPFHDIFVDFLIIKTNDIGKYECFIAQPKSFVLTLKKLNKSHLLSKDSKYLDLIKTK